MLGFASYDGDEASIRTGSNRSVKDHRIQCQKCVKSISMPKLTIKTLGGIKVSHQGCEFRPTTKKALALLIYLALSPGGSYSREHLAGLLWGRSAEEQARASLRQTLSSLRKSLGGQSDLLFTNAEDVQIKRELLDIDAIRFSQLARSNDHQDQILAIEIYEGEFLQGFSLKADEFEEWQGYHRQQYNEIAIQLLARMIEHSLMLKEYETGVRYAQRLLSLDPVQEQAHRALIELYIKLDRREDSLRQFEECTQLLKKELGVSPGPETTALYQSILAGESSGKAKPVATEELSTGSTFSPLQSKKPSIAVLPFDNLSADPSQQYLSDAITEDLVSNLAHDRWFDVIAKTATQQFRDNKTGVIDIAQAVGARYLLDGSLRKSGNQIRISVALIDGSDARQIWSQRYDSADTDIFELQDQIAVSIAAAVIPELNTAEQQSAKRKHPQNLDTWSCCHKAFWHLYTFDLDQLEQAQSMFEQAIVYDPSYSQPHAGLAYSQMMHVWYDSSKKHLLDSANQNARQAIQLDNRDSYAHFVLGRVLSMQSQYNDAVLEFEAAIELNPSFGRAYFGLASVWVYSGHYAKAVAPIDTAIRLSPADPHLWTFYNIKARSLTGLGHYEEAELWARKAVRQPSATFWCDLALVSALGYLEREDEARLALQNLHRKKPGYSCEQYARDDFVLSRDAHKLVVEGLRKAGLPERDSEKAE
jgi:DNA-binding SARP family transcriptional activator/Flp pilus assembly protein TadD